MFPGLRLFQLTYRDLFYCVLSSESPLSEAALYAFDVDNVFINAYVRSSFNICVYAYKVP